jgi:hypothetical protein
MKELELFQDAAEAGDSTQVIAILGDNPDLVGTMFDDEKTPLHWAAWFAFTDVVTKEADSTASLW